ncbi:MAG: WYL domain-containing protein, partial [Nitrososphaerota archaeon]
RDEPFISDGKPQGTFWDRGRWYLATNGAAVDVAKGMAKRVEQRLWRADRVVGISAHGHSTASSAEFDIGTLLGHAWLASAMTVWRERAPVRLRITSGQARRLQQDWYYRFAQYEAAEDGSVIMTFGERDSDLVIELVRWLGPGAEILSPAPWRATLREQLKAMLQRLDDTGL